jgi:hypothetical protein
MNSLNRGPIFATAIAIMTLLSSIPATTNAEDADVLAAWRTGVKIRPVLPDTVAHTIHTYFNVSPESPDGRYVLFYRSVEADAQHGELCIIERATGKETILARDVRVEDAHRAAAQQWVSNGKRVAFQNERNGEWFVSVVDLDTGKERVLAPGRLIGLTQANSDFIPVYGPHWKLGEHRDLEMVNVATGEMQTVLTNDAVRKAYPEYCQKVFGDRAISIFFPILSPDQTRVFFKLSAPLSGRAQSADSSIREGLIGYSLSEKRFLFCHERWGHPFWHRDSKTIVQQHDLLINSDNGDTTRIPDLPDYYASHPSSSPDGKILLKDMAVPQPGVDRKKWKIIGIDLCDIRGKHELIIDQFDNSKGAKSWRVSHAHPVFSPDGKRIYYNMSSGDWTRLFVAERSDAK